MNKIELHVRWNESVGNSKIECHHVNFGEYNATDDTYKITANITGETLNKLITLAGANGIDIKVIESDGLDPSLKEMGAQICDKCKGSGSAITNKPSEPYEVCMKCGGAGITFPEIPLAEIEQTQMDEFVNQCTIEGRHPFAYTDYVTVSLNGKKRHVPVKLKFDDIVVLAGYKPGTILSVTWERPGTNGFGKCVIPKQEIKVKDGDLIDAGRTDNA